MTRYRWLIASGLALLLVAVVALGYQLGPSLVSAAQQREPVAEATPVPPAEPASRQGRGWLGVAVSSVEGGVRVAEVVRDGPAASAGLQRGDTITAVDGGAVANAKELTERIAGMEPGQQANLAVQRDGSIHTITVTLGTRPEPRRVAPKSPQIDINPFGALGRLAPELRDIPADQRFDHLRGATFSYTDKEGNLVTIGITPGVLTAVSADAVALRPNGGSADVSFRVGEKTHVLPGGQAQIADTMKVQDKVVVVARQGSDEAFAILDQTAVRERRGLPKPSRGSLKPAPNGEGFRLVPGERSGEEFRRWLPGLERRLDELRQRFDGAAAGASS